MEDGRLSQLWNQKHAPVDYLDWVARGAGRRASGHPDAWRVDPQFEFETNCRLGVVMHVYYPDLAAEIIERLQNLPVDFDLFITDASKSGLTLSRDEISASLPRLQHLVIVPVENHGRDIYPLIQLVNFGALDPYQLVLKVHTKKSAWREAHTELEGTGAEWKDEFLDALLGSEDEVKRIMSAFGSDPWLGLVTAPGNIVGPEFWGGDKAITAELLRRLEIRLHPSRLKFAAGSMYWVRGFVLQGLRSLGLSEDDFDPEAGQIDATTAHAIERAIGILTTEAGLKLRETDGLTEVKDSAAELWSRYSPAIEITPSVRFVPFYLPQFHPTAENDRWWGTGFTEWTNVTGAKPVYQGHDQPKLPADFGFYDLRLDEVRAAQAEMASKHGVNGFMYYYYWFAGKRLLNLPIEKLHASDPADVNMPFCLMWANENWTRSWDGRNKDILIGQEYDKVPAEEFIDDVAEFMKDPRYMRVDGRAILAVYRPAQIPNFPRVVAHWRARARELGVGELWLLSVDVATEFDGLGASARELGLEGSLGFPPHNLPWEGAPAGSVKMRRKMRGSVLSYPALVRVATERLRRLPRDLAPGVMVNFDNTARRQWKPDVWYGANPYLFRRWLAAAARAVMDRPVEERLVFINAWNEWAEGAILEPTQRFGRSYLQAVRDVAFG
ncbi:glycosyl transferase family 2 [Mobiluncus holmesii]|uniref:Glycosyl transferase family 2 n=2 Tax=Mobiluncus porci TaxID=2652278 RepID=A0A7K0K3J3_9ACTO|nr:glycoside hydrolase family 99-like domain-containing protein [Mobiluncus porci]MST50053.1 glycosyl transferase family 2 [Mobiluncus porci]